MIKSNTLKLRQEKKLKSLALKPFDDLYKLCSNAAKQFSVNYVPIELIENNISTLKNNVISSSNEDKEFNKFKEQYFKLLDSLYNTLKAVSDKFQGRVALHLIKEAIDLIKKNF